MAGRIERRFAELRAADRAAFVAFLTAGDPDLGLSSALLEGLPAAGADIIELGMPFSDPMADGPTIQLGNLRALAAGATLAATLELVARFRDGDAETPLVLMGYYNPIYRYGGDAFVAEAARVGVDGLILVDLPPEEDAELREPAADAGPTSSAWRRRPATTRACRRCFATARASSTTSRSRASPAPPPPTPMSSAARSRACGGTRTCRSPSASACARPTRRQPSPAPPTAWWSARRW